MSHRTKKHAFALRDVLVATAVTGLAAGVLLPVMAAGPYRTTKTSWRI